MIQMPVEAKNIFTKSLLITFSLAFLLLIYIWDATSTFGIFSAFPYFMILYFIFFSIGNPIISDWLGKELNGELKRLILFPSVLIIIYYSYIILNGANPFDGTNFLFPYLIYFPVLILSAKHSRSNQIDWLDFFAFVIFLLPTTLVKFDPNTSIPFNGKGFDDVNQIVIVLTAVYSFAVVRGIKDVGFYPIFKWKYLGITILSWISFYSFAILVGYLTHFLEFVGHDSITSELLSKILWGLVSVFLHTAIFEELFFRGILQNILAKKIKQSANWKLVWSWGLGILFLFSLLVGYTLDGNLQWLPALMTLSIFVVAYLIEKNSKATLGAFTAMAIASVIFGLVHYHAGSIVYISLASLAGWAYGYTYYKTKNVFYSALVHALVNNTFLIIGIKLLK